MSHIAADLPVDLYPVLASFIDEKSDLFHLALVSKAFKAGAEQILYEEICFSDSGLHSERQLSKTLLANQDKCNLVTRVTIGGFRDRAWKETDETVFAAVAKLRRVEVMVVDMKSWGPNDHAWLLRLTQPYEALRVFKCNGPDKHVIAFIHRQPAIRSLVLLNYQQIDFSDIDIEAKRMNMPSATSHLNHIHGYPNAVVYFVPGRPVESVAVQIIPGFISIASIISACALSTKALDRLYLLYNEIAPQYRSSRTAFIFSPEHIHLVAEHLPQLKELYIEIPLLSSDIYRVGGKHADPYIQALSQLKSLKTLRLKNEMPLAFEHPYHDRLFDRTDHAISCSNILNAITKTMPNLTQIEFCEKRLSLKDGLYVATVECEKDQETVLRYPNILPLD